MLPHSRRAEAFQFSLIKTRAEISSWVTKLLHSDALDRIISHFNSFLAAMRRLILTAAKAAIIKKPMVENTDATMGMAFEALDSECTASDSAIGAAGNTGLGGAFGGEGNRA
jgi:hypothetical protein